MPKTTKPDIAELDRIKDEYENCVRHYMSASFEKDEAIRIVAACKKEMEKAHTRYMRARAAARVPEEEKQDAEYR